MTGKYVFSYYSGVLFIGCNNDFRLVFIVYNVIISEKRIMLLIFFNWLY